MFGKRFKEDCLVLDSFVALPLAAKLSMAALPGNEVMFFGLNVNKHFRISSQVNCYGFLSCLN